MISYLMCINCYICWNSARSKNNIYPNVHRRTSIYINSLFSLLLILKEI